MNHPLGPGAELPTTERLARAIEAELAKQWKTLDQKRRTLVTLFAQRAREGWFDDYKSKSPTPIHDLVRVASQIGFDDIAERAKEGEFDGTRAEAEAWGSSVEGVIEHVLYAHLLPNLMEVIRRASEETETEA